MYLAYIFLITLTVPAAPTLFFIIQLVYYARRANNTLQNYARKPF